MKRFALVGWLAAAVLLGFVIRAGMEPAVASVPSAQPTSTTAWLEQYYKSAPPRNVEAVSPGKNWAPDPIPPRQSSQAYDSWQTGSIERANRERNPFGPSMPPAR